VRWLRRQPRLLFSHLPLETPTQRKYAAINKQLGVCKGVPDYLIVDKRSHRILFVELKRSKGGVVSKAQERWLEALSWRHAVVCRGYKEARSTIEEYFDL